MLLSCYGNVPPERAAQVIGMLLGVQVSAGLGRQGLARVTAQLAKAGFDEAMLAALAGRGRAGRRRDPGERAGPVRASGRGAQRRGEADPEENGGTAAAGAPHVLIARTPDERLALLQAIGSRRKGSVAAAVPASFTGYLITDGYTGYQHLLSLSLGIQQCAQHVNCRCRAVTKLGPGSLQAGPPALSRSCARRNFGTSGGTRMSAPSPRSSLTQLSQRIPLSPKAWVSAL